MDTASCPISSLTANQLQILRFSFLEYAVDHPIISGAHMKYYEQKTLSTFSVTISSTSSLALGRRLVVDLVFS